MPGCVVALRLDCRVDGVGVDPRDPPLRWEAYDGEGWVPCEVGKDDTGGFNQAGEVILHLPARHSASTVAGHPGGWLRCRLREADPGQRTYVASPTVGQVTAFTIGGTVEAMHAENVGEEALGRSEGVSGQSFQVARPPVEPTGEPFVVEVAENDGWVQWQRVEDFGLSGRDDRHFTVDLGSGRVDFGPAVRQPDGSVRKYGAVPTKDGAVRVRGYRTGGGKRGNVSRHALRVLRSSVPFVARVENRQAAVGGVDGETVEEARVRGPLTLRSMHRAVVAGDYERLALEIAPDIARAKCVPAHEVASADGTGGADGVRLLVVPAGRTDERGRIDFRDLRPPQETLDRITSHLEGLRPVGTRVMVEPPHYRGMTVIAWVRPKRGAARGPLVEEGLTALYRHFNPLIGGPEGQGWPFGRAVHSGQVFAVLQEVPGVDFVEEVKLFPADPATGARADQVGKIVLEPHSLLFSFAHELKLREG